MTQTKNDIKKLYEEEKTVDDKLVLLEERLDSRLQEQSELLVKAIKESERTIIKNMAGMLETVEKTLIHVFDMVSEKYDKKLRQSIKNLLIEYEKLVQESAKSEDFDKIELTTLIGKKISDLLMDMEKRMLDHIDEEHRGTQLILYGQVDSLKEFIKEVADKMEYNIMVDNAHENRDIKEMLKKIDWHILEPRYTV